MGDPWHQVRNGRGLRGRAAGVQARGLLGRWECWLERKVPEATLEHEPRGGFLQGTRAAPKSKHGYPSVQCLTSWHWCNRTVSNLGGTAEALQPALGAERWGPHLAGHTCPILRHGHGRWGDGRALLREQMYPRPHTGQDSLLCARPLHRGGGGQEQGGLTKTVTRGGSSSQGPRRGLRMCAKQGSLPGWSDSVVEHRPMHREVVGSIPGQGTCPGFGSIPGVVCAGGS